MKGLSVLAIVVMLLNLLLVPGAQAKVLEPKDESSLWPEGQQGCG